jgi:signal transduction histidine kinase
MTMAQAQALLSNPLEAYLTLSEPRRGWAYTIASVLVAVIAYSDWKLVEVSVGFLYVLPILMASATLRGWQIVLLAVACALLREWFSPLHGTPGVAVRVGVGAVGFALAGYFVSQLDRQRRSIAQHLREREQEVQRRLDAERQLQVVIDTSPLGILTLNSEGRVLLANESAEHLFRMEVPSSLRGREIHPYLPILERFLDIQHTAEVCTAVESRGQRADGDTFLAHIWLSTLASQSGPCLAAFIWDASENLHDREASGLDSMMATSRVLIGAISHEIRNLAAAAAISYRELTKEFSNWQGERLRALGTVIQALENIATSGLRLAAHSLKSVADLSMVLDEARVLIGASIRDMGGTAYWKIPDGLPLVEADHHSLLQVFLNLARNSEAAMKGVPEKILWVEASVDEAALLVAFRDTGAGVANPESLFRPFQAGAASTGLGLYISRAVLKSYGGDLHCAPNSRGGCFVVRLRVAADAANPGMSQS